LTASTTFSVTRLNAPFFWADRHDASEDEVLVSNEAFGIWLYCVRFAAEDILGGGDCELGVETGFDL